MMKLNVCWRAIILITFLVTISTIFIIRKQTSKQTLIKVESTASGCDSIEYESNDVAKTASIICIKSGNKTKSIVVKDALVDHYHTFEKNKNNVYLLTRTGYDGHSDFGWTDELWVYNTQLEAKKLYSDRGLDFRISPDRKLIAITTNDYFKLLDINGKTLHSFSSIDVIANNETVPRFNILAWGTGSLWLDNTFGPSLQGLAKIYTDTYKVEKYDLTDLNAGSEYSVNVFNDKIAFSNFPALFEEYSVDRYMKSGSKVNLVVYDLKSKIKSAVDTSTTKRFSPKWLDAYTLEYDNPNGAGKVTKVIK